MRTIAPVNPELFPHGPVWHKANPKPLHSPNGARAEYRVIFLSTKTACVPCAAAAGALPDCVQCEKVSMSFDLIDPVARALVSIELLEER